MAPLFRTLVLTCALTLAPLAGCYGDVPDSPLGDETGDETGDDTAATDTPADETGADETGADETGADETGADETGAGETGADETGAAPGIMYYESPLEGGNEFACATCHALSEPTDDGIRRPGHPIGDATRRTSWKNGQLGSVLEAVQSCQEEWMNAEPWTADDPAWLALEAFLDSQPGEGEAPPVSFQIVTPPDVLTGGDAVAGQALFNDTCVVCHGEDGAGGMRGPILAGTGLTEDYVAQRIRLSGDADSPVYDGLLFGLMPFWSLERLSDDELRDIAAFLVQSESPGDDTGDDTGVDETGGDETGGDETGGDVVGSCDATHPKVGWTTQLSNLFHMVGGTATILDDCTIVVDDFTFDGNGIEVRFYGGNGGDYTIPISDDLFNWPVGYDHVQYVITLPDDVSLDDFDGISVWCVAVGISFGDGIFGAP